MRAPTEQEGLGARVGPAVLPQVGTEEPEGFSWTDSESSILEEEAGAGEDGMQCLALAVSMLLQGLLSRWRAEAEESRSSWLDSAGQGLLQSDCRFPAMMDG